MNALLHSLFESCVSYTQGQNNSDSLAQLPHSRGIVLFADASDAPILLVIAADIRRLVQNRLNIDETVHTKRTKLSQIVGKIFYLTCWCEFNCLLQHYLIAQQLFPNNYRDVVELPKSWYVQINTSDKWPYFFIADRADTNAGKQSFGPFACRKDAQRYATLLEDAFGLCKRTCLIDCSQKAASCPYYQMKTCSAPCMGKTSRYEYFEQINDAIAAAGGHRKAIAEKLNAKMRDLASKMDFEGAEIVKKRLTALKQFQDNEYKWICNITDLAIIHIDQGQKIKVKGQKKKTQTYMAFLIGANSISQFSDFTLAQTQHLLENIKSVSNAVTNKSHETNTEFLSFAAFELYRSNPPGLWLDYRKTITSGELSSLIENKFNSPQ